MCISPCDSLLFLFINRVCNKHDDLYVCRATLLFFRFTSPRSRGARIADSCIHCYLAYSKECKYIVTTGYLVYSGRFGFRLVMKSYPSQPCMSGLNGRERKPDALAHSKHTEYTKHELTMNQSKGARNDRVSEKVKRGLPVQWLYFDLFFMQR